MTREFRQITGRVMLVAVLLTVSGAIGAALAVLTSVASFQTIR